MNEKKIKKILVRFVKKVSKIKLFIFYLNIFRKSINGSGDNEKNTEEIN